MPKKKTAKFDPNDYPIRIANQSPQRSSRVRITGDTGPSMQFTLPMPYQPEFASPERVQWPIDRLQQNRYWRLFCFVPGTPVVTHDGLRKSIEDFKIGDLVISHKNNTRKVTNTFEHLVNEEVYKIYVSGQHEPLIVTGEHPFLINNLDHFRYCGCEENCGEELPKRAREINTRHKVGHYNKGKGRITRESKCLDKPERNETNIKWEVAQNIKEGDELLCPIQNQCIINAMSEDKAWLLGLFVAEGCYIKSKNKQGKFLKAVRFALNLKKEKDTLGKKVREIIKKEYGLDAKFYESPDRNCLEVRVYSRQIADEFYAFCGEYSYEKYIREDILHWTLDLQKAFIKGLFQGDGYYKKTPAPTISWATGSKNLVDQVRKILTNLGIGCVYVVRAKSQDKLAKHDAHIISITGNFARELGKFIWETDCPISTKAQKLNFIQKIENEYISYRITKIEKIKYKGPVYNIEVDGDNTYLAGQAGYITHNCKTDPVISTVIDLYAEIIASDFTTAGEGVDGSIKDTYDYMIEKTNIISAFKYFTSEYLVLGEVIPHLVFDTKKGIWTSLIFHNPDQIKVIDSPFIALDPILEFTPDETLRALARSTNPTIIQVMSKLPAEVQDAIISGRNIPLDTSLNATFLARKIHPYDVRGTSIFTRLYRILMYEDAVMNCFSNKNKVLSSDYLYKPIGEFQVGDKVIDKDGHAQIVEAAWDEGIKTDLIKISLLGGSVLECTENHKFPVFAYPRICADGCGGVVNSRKSFISTHGRGKIKNWISYGSNNIKSWAKRRLLKSYNPYQDLQAKDLRKHDYLMVPRKFDELYTDTISAEARLLGYYIAEGCKLKLSNGGYGIRWSMNFSEKESWIKDISNLCSELGVNTNIYTQEYNHSCTIDFCRHEHSHFAEWFLHHGGEYSKTKKLSEDVMRWSLNLKKELIKGCFRGDGSFSKCKSGQYRVSYSSASEHLIKQIRTILMQLGIFTGYRVYKNNGKSQGTLHQLTATGSFARDLISWVWEKELDFGIHQDSLAWVDDNYVYVPITKIERIKTNEKVYNLTVSGSHSYIVEGFGVHNCSIATARRHSGPLKIAKLGDKDLRWVPEQSYQDKIIQLLTVAEQDPHSFLLLPWFVNFEAFGTTDKMMNVGREWDIIERIKLTALGVSQGFLHGECFVKDTKVLTENYINKPIQDIKEGEKVIDKDGHIQEVTAAWQSNTPEFLTQIELWGGKTLTSTTNHKYPVWAWMRICACGCGGSVKSGQLYSQGHYARTSKQELNPVDAIGQIRGKRLKGILKSYNPYRKLEASEIRPYDCLMIPRKFDEITVPKNITLDHAKLLGFYVAEGCKTESNGYESVQWTFNKKERDTFAKEVIDAGNNLEMYFSVSLKKGNTCVVQAARQEYKPFYDWLLFNGGRYSHGKQLSSDVMRWPLSFKEELIKSMFKGDGSRSYLIKKDKRVNKEYQTFVVQYGTVSKILADQICLILAQLGIFASVDRVKISKKSKYQKHDAYNIRCYSVHAKNLAKLVWDDEVILSKDTRSHFWVDDNYVYVPVKSVKTIENTEKTPVYNLTVDNDHSYIAEGMGSYNSTYASMKGNMQTLLMRLNGLRQHFVSSWFIPKFFRPIAEMNKWVKKPKKSDTKGSFRKKQGEMNFQDEENYIIPDIQWSRSLDSKTDTELMDTYEQLVNRLGMPLSKKTVFPAAGVDYEAEMKNLAEEKLDAEKLAKEMGVSEQTLTGKEPEAGAAPSVGGAPTAEEGEESIELTPVGEGGETAPEAIPAGASKKKVSSFKEKLLAKEKLQKEAENKIRANEVKDLLNDEIFTELVDLIKTGKSSPYWRSILKKDEKPEQFSKNFDWDRVSDFLYNDDFKEYHIEGIRQELIRQEVIDPSREDKLRELVSGLSPDDDEQLYKVIDQVISSGDSKVAEKVNSLFLGPVNAAKRSKK